MSKKIQDLIKDLEKQLQLNAEQSDWHLKQFKGYEARVLTLRESIQELKDILCKEKCSNG